MQCPHKNLHGYIFRHLIHNCQNLEANMSFSRWTVSKLQIHTMDYQSVIERNKILIHVTTLMNLTWILSHERQISGHQGFVKRKGWVDEAQGYFRAVNLFCMVLYSSGVMPLCIYQNPMMLTAMKVNQMIFPDL